jgi:hypothetical protein
LPARRAQIPGVEEKVTRENLLLIRALCLLAGAALGIAGMVTENKTLVWVGVGFLAVGIIVRIINRAKKEE